MKRGKIIALLLTAVFLLPVQAQAEPTEGIDALLLIDTSGSMRDSDSSRNAIEATKMFIDMLDTQNSRVGIIGFNDNLTGVIDITEIDGIEDKERLKRIVDGFDYAGWTDIGLPLKEAVGIMSRNMRTTNSPMVLLLTDGNIELGENNPERTVEESYTDVVDAVNSAGRDLPIYTIGLNYDGTVDRNFLRTISDSTGARSYVVTEATDLPQIFNEIFADHVKSQLIEVASFTADGDYTDVNINIDSDFVAVANVIMLSENGILDARLYDPDGNETVIDQSTITFSSSSKYSIIKVLFPKKGAWLLQVQGVSGDQVRVNLIYQYNISVDIELAQAEAIGRLFDPSSPVEIRGRILVNDEPIEDDSLYRLTATNALVTDLQDNLLAKIPLTATPDGLVGYYTPTSDEPAVVHIEMLASSFIKESPEIVMQFEQLPTATDTPATPTEPEPEPLPEPEVNSRDFLVYALIGAAIILLLALVLFLLLRKRKPKFFDGYLEVRAMNESGVYTSLETPPLLSYVGTIELNQFLMDTMPAKTRAEIAGLPFTLKNITLTPAQGAILLENKSASEAADADGAVIGRKYTWQPGQKVIIRGDDDSSAKLELTYMVDELL